MDAHALAEALVAARRHRAALRAAEWTAALHDAHDAYDVQDTVARRLGWFDGAPPRHWKSGGPARDAALTHAPLPPAGVHTSPARLHELHFHAPGIEAEIALRLGGDRDLGGRGAGKARRRGGGGVRGHRASHRRLVTHAAVRSKPPFRRSRIHASRRSSRDSWMAHA